ncbi:MAG: methyltransferase domain-containing protein [Alphaproteobacteria bacterium]|nr:methyltransferase domain-containing protein [Alphaproteobacteria bacterium]
MRNLAGKTALSVARKPQNVIRKQEETMDDARHRALTPAQDAIRALPLTTNVKIAGGIFADRRARAIDIGCGEGKFTRALGAHFDEVHGADVKASSIAKAQAAALAEKSPVAFQIASGQALPFADGYFDTVVFSNSLHHMPDPAKALEEAARVTKSGGLLYVMEPVASGNYHEATRLVNDETIVRREAWQAMKASGAFRHEQEILYRARRSFADFEEWKAGQIERSESRRAKFDANPELVRKTFEDAADREDGRLAFDQVFRVDVLRKA